MEVFAGFLEHTDVQVGKLIDELEARGIRDNTLVIYILSDNGASAEGMNGSIAELNAQNGIPTTVAEHMEVLEGLGGLDAIGGPKTDNMYHSAWAWAGDSALPLHQADRGRFRRNAHSDGYLVACADQARQDTTAAVHITSTTWCPRSMRFSASSRRRLSTATSRIPSTGQLCLHLRFGNRPGTKDRPSTSTSWAAAASTTKAGWPARSAPHPLGSRVPDISNWDPMQDEWELFNTRRDFSDARSGRRGAGEARRPQGALHARGQENKVLPIGGGLLGPLFPQEMKRSTNTEWTLFEGMTRIPESQAPNVRNGNVRAEIEAEVPENVNGVIFAMGGYAGGVSLYALDGELYYEYSALLLKRDKIKVGKLPAGEVKIEFEMRTPVGASRARRGQVLDQRQGGGHRHGAAYDSRHVHCFRDVRCRHGHVLAGRDDYFDKAPFKFEGKLKRVLLQEPARRVNRF
jgi:hypothetical protein